jgi:hypothetical protein
VKPATVSFGTVWATAVLAAALWFVTFYLGFSIFWIKIGFSAALLAAFALWRDPPAARPRLDVAAVVQGVVSAVALWGIFWVGKQVSTLILPFAEGQIGAIYGKGEGFSPAVIFFLLLLVTGPCEEIYWRGFLQKHLMGRYGHLKGWLAASAVYALVHIWSFNFMLIGAAAVAGAFWGLCYWRWGRLTPVVISHSLWSAVVFSLAPIP